MPAFSLTIYFSQTHLKLCSLFFHIYYFNPFYTIGLQYQATWRALCLGLRIRHVSRGEGESFVPQNPLILRDHVPSSFLRPELPPVSETHVSPLFEVRVPPVLIEARAASCPRPACFGFRGPSTSAQGFPICNSKELISSNSNTYNYIYNSHSSKTVERRYSYSYSLLYNCCMLL